jgi:hypothetical protein
MQTTVVGAINNPCKTMKFEKTNKQKSAEKTNKQTKKCNKEIK